MDFLVCDEIFSFRNNGFLALPWGHSEENEFKILECLRYLRINAWCFG